MSAGELFLSFLNGEEQKRKRQKRRVSLLLPFVPGQNSKTDGVSEKFSGLSYAFDVVFYSYFSY